MVRNDLYNTGDYASEGVEQKEVPSRRRLDCGNSQGSGSGK